ncbi:hypothetical protein pdam_00010935, partial [Pocillopora damicornis]
LKQRRQFPHDLKYPHLSAGNFWESFDYRISLSSSAIEDFTGLSCLDRLLYVINIFSPERSQIVLYFQISYLTTSALFSGVSLLTITAINVDRLLALNRNSCVEGIPVLASQIPTLELPSHMLKTRLIDEIYLCGWESWVSEELIKTSLD